MARLQNFSHPLSNGGERNMNVSPVYGLRFIFALCIVFIHLHIGNIVLAKMVLASFFVMSGFFLEMRHSFQSIDSKRWIKFEINHFSRLFPLQWLCVAAWLMLSTTPLNVNAIYHYFLVQSWIPDSKFIFTPTGVRGLSPHYFSYICCFQSYHQPPNAYQEYTSFQC